MQPSLLAVAVLLHFGACGLDGAALDDAELSATCIGFDMKQQLTLGPNYACPFDTDIVQVSSVEGANPSGRARPGTYSDYAGSLEDFTQLKGWSPTGLAPFQAYRYEPDTGAGVSYHFLPEVAGSGYLTRLWFTHNQGGTDFHKVGQLHVVADGAAVVNQRVRSDPPSASDFFASDPPFTYSYEDNASFYTYRPIPFDHSLRAFTRAPCADNYCGPRFWQATVKLVDSLDGTAQPADYSGVAPMWLQASSDFHPYFGRVGTSAVLTNRVGQEINLSSPGTLYSVRIEGPRSAVDGTSLQIWWDGASDAAVDAPLRALFNVNYPWAQQELASYQSVGLGTECQGDSCTFYMHFPMPYQSARLLVTNPAFTIRASRVDAQVSDLRFRARTVTRRIEPGSRGNDNHRALDHHGPDPDAYVAIDVAGSGKLAGVIFNGYSPDRSTVHDAVNGKNDDWKLPFLESNMYVFYDGRRLLGTGAEDEFNAGYYCQHGPRSFPMSGCLAVNSIIEFATLYRLYLGDAVDFDDHLAITFEHGLANASNLRASYATTVFYYLRQ